MKRSEDWLDRQWWRFVMWQMKKDFFKDIGYKWRRWSELMAHERIEPSKATIEAVRDGWTQSRRRMAAEGLAKTGSTLAFCLQ